MVYCKGVKYQQKEKFAFPNTFEVATYMVSKHPLNTVLEA